MSLLPRPPLDDAGALRLSKWDITAHLAQGPFGVCAVCTGSVWRWWDLTLCDMPPIVDRYGQLTDQVPLHPSCVDELIEEWASMLAEDSGGDEGAVSPDAVPEGPATGVLATSERRRVPSGAYAR